jgi:hypothetical protein
MKMSFPRFRPLIACPSLAAIAKPSDQLYRWHSG